MAKTHTFLTPAESTVFGHNQTSLAIDAAAAGLALASDIFVVDDLISGRLVRAYSMELRASPVLSTVCGAVCAQVEDE